MRPKSINLAQVNIAVFIWGGTAIFASGLKNLSAKTVGILASLLPVYGGIFGYLIHDERVALRTVLGGGLLLMCVIFETVKQASPKQTPMSSR